MLLELFLHLFCLCGEMPSQVRQVPLEYFLCLFERDLLLVHLADEVLECLDNALVLVGELLEEVSLSFFILIQFSDHFLEQST